MPPRFPRSQVGRQGVAQSLTPGAGRGRSAVVTRTPANPPPMRAVPGEREIATFAVIGDMVVQTSGKHTVQSGGHLTVVSEATGVGTGTTDFDILLNGTPAGAGVSLASSTTSQTDELSELAVPGDKLQLDITAPGMHPDLVVQVVMDG